MSISTEETKLDVSGVEMTFPAQKRGGEAHHVLSDVTFSIKTGEIVSFVGRSGCGKTTLLRIVAGLSHPNDGTIAVDGTVVAGPGRDRAVVFQQPALFPWRTALRNVEFGLELRKDRSPEYHREALDALDLVGLSKYAQHYPYQMSGGMQQRVGLARALAVEPELLLMDEPFSAIDAQTREELQEQLLDLHRRTSKTIMFVTHDLDEAVFLSDRIVVLRPDPGRIHTVIEVDIPRPRPGLVEARSLPEFVRARVAVGRAIGVRDDASS